MVNDFSTKNSKNCYFLDSFYSERYMGFPNVTDNYKGYEEADLKKKVTHLKDKMLYIVHGTADKNVQLQQSMVLTKVLAQHGVLFRQQVSNHFIFKVKM